MTQYSNGLCLILLFVGNCAVTGSRKAPKGLARFFQWNRFGSLYIKSQHKSLTNDEQIEYENLATTLKTQPRRTSGFDWNYYGKLHAKEIAQMVGLSKDCKMTQKEKTDLFLMKKQQEQLTKKENANPIQKNKYNKTSHRKQ